MIRVLGRILIILLVTAAFGFAVYLIASATTQSGADNPSAVLSSDAAGEQTLTQPPQGSHEGGGARDGSGNRGGGETAEGLTSLTLVELLKDLSIITIVTIVVALIRKSVTRKTLPIPVGAE
jgi:hypothetical protein